MAEAPTDAKPTSICQPRSFRPTTDGRPIISSKSSLGSIEPTQVLLDNGLHQVAVTPEKIAKPQRLIAQGLSPREAAAATKIGTSLYTALKG